MGGLQRMHSIVRSRVRSVISEITMAVFTVSVKCLTFFLFVGLIVWLANGKAGNLSPPIRCNQQSKQELDLCYQLQVNVFLPIMFCNLRRYMTMVKLVGFDNFCQPALFWYFGFVSPRSSMEEIKGTFSSKPWFRVRTTVVVSEPNYAAVTEKPPNVFKRPVHQGNSGEFVLTMG